MILSKRFEQYDLSGEVNPITQDLHSYIQSGKPLFDLTISNPTKAEIDYPHREIIRSVATRNILQYNPNPRGALEAREAICEYYSDLGFTLSVDNLFLTSGTSEAYSYLLKLLCNVGDTILVPAPSYPLLDFIATLEGINIAYYNLILTDKGTWTIDFESLVRKTNKPAKVILFIQPNNPTGNILTSEELEKLILTAERNNVPLIIDEVFRDYLFVEKRVPLLTSEQIPIFTLNGISKTLALPQFKLGWILVSSPQPLQREILEGLELICDTYLSVNTPVQVALKDLFPLRKIIQTKILNRLNDNLILLSTILENNKNIKLYIPTGGWYAVFEFFYSESDEETAIKLLKQTGVFLHPGFMFRFAKNNFFVVSLLTPTHIFKEGVNRINEFFSNG